MVVMLLYKSFQEDAFVEVTILTNGPGIPNGRPNKTKVKCSSYQPLAIFG